MKMLAYFLVVAAGAGLLAAGHVHWHGWNIDHSVKPLDVATLLINLAVVLLIQDFVTRRASVDRVEKDILIEDAKRILTEANDVSDKFAQRVEKGNVSLTDWRTSVAGSKRLSSALEQLWWSLRAVHCKKCGALKSEEASIKEAFFSFKAAVTNDPPGVRLSIASVKNEAVAYKALVSAIKGLIFTINAH